jgi:LacI family transcriptional regulator
MPSGITQAQLARMLGIDRSSVSLALQDSPKISADMRRKIQHLARKHGYHPNLAARLLKGGQPQIVGLVLSEAFHSLSEPVVVGTIQALARQVSEAGMVFSLRVAGESAVASTAARPIASDGLLVWGDVPAEAAVQFGRRGSRALVLDPSHPSYAAYAGPAVRLDNAGGATAMVRHLVERGAERLWFVRVQPDHLGHEARWQAARTEWRRRHPASTLRVCAPDDLSDADLRRIASTRGAALFCSNDDGAQALWLRLIRLGIAMPKAVRLAGFDGTAAARQAGITTALFDCDRLATTALHALSLLMQDKPLKRAPEPVPVTLCPGETS